MKRRWWLAGVLGAACMHPAASTSSTTAEVAADTVWYVSARARDEGLVTTRLADSLEFGFVVVTYQRSGDLLTQDLDLDVHDSTRLGRAEFVAALKARAADFPVSDPMAVLYVHGYGTWQHEALRSTATSMVRSRSRAPWVVFCWPSRGSGLASPSTRAILTNGYWIDSVTAAASAPAFGTAMSAVLDAVGGAHTLVVAHSMGAQIVSEALMSDTALRARLSADSLRALAYFAPDIDAVRFHDVIVPAVHPLARRVVLYASENDRTLSISRMLNKGDRAGLIRGPPGTDTASVLEAVDVSDGLSSGGMFQRTFGNHHALSRAPSALFDILFVVGGAMPPGCRVTLGTGTHTGGNGWKLTKTPPPPPQALEACATVR